MLGLVASEATLLKLDHTIGYLSNAGALLVFVLGAGTPFSNIVYSVQILTGRPDKLSQGSLTSF